MDILSRIGYTTVDFSLVVRINWYNVAKPIKNSLLKKDKMAAKERRFARFTDEEIQSK